MGCARPNPVITRLSAHGRTPRGLSRLVLRIIPPLQNLAGGIENPVQQKRKKEQSRKTSGKDETVFRISEPVADGTHRKRPENGGTTCEKQNHPATVPCSAFRKQLMPLEFIVG